MGTALVAGISSSVLLYPKQEQPKPGAPTHLSGATEPVREAQETFTATAAQTTGVAADSLRLSPAFNEYAKAVDYVKRTEAVRSNIHSTLQHIVQNLQVEDTTREAISRLITDALDEQKIRERLAQRLSDALNEDELKTLEDLFHDPISQKLTERENALLQQSPELLAKYMEKYGDRDSYALALKSSQDLIDELGIWHDVQDLFTHITDSLLSGLNRDKKIISEELFQGTAQSMLESQRQVLRISTLYLYDGLSQSELKRFKEIYKSQAAVKERQIIYTYFGQVFAQVGSSMGQLAARSE